MFDLSWIELIFCAILALVVVGPRDMPRLLKLLGNAMRRARKFYGEIQAGVRQLENEADIASGSSQQPQWQDYLPEDLQRLPADFRPGQLDAEAYQTLRRGYQAEVDRARARHAARQDTAATQPPLAPSAEAAARD